MYAEREVVEPRPTDDIDVIIEIMSYKERAQLEDKLRRKGITHDVEASIVCRYIINGITVDIIPTDDPSIGFHPRWYLEGFKNSIPYQLDGQLAIRIL